MKRKRSPFWKTRVFAGTVLPGRSTLLDLRTNVRWMPTDGQLRELHAAMRRLFWKMLRVLMPGRSCIPISSRRRVMRIVRLTKANESSCWKSVAKKFEMLTVKHAMPNVNWIAQTKVGIK